MTGEDSLFGYSLFFFFKDACVAVLAAHCCYYGQGAHRVLAIVIIFKVSCAAAGAAHALGHRCVALAVTYIWSITIKERQRAHHALHGNTPGGRASPPGPSWPRRT